MTYKKSENSNSIYRTLNGNYCKTFDDYYDPMADNYVIPKSEMTEEIWESIMEKISEPYTYDNGYCLITTTIDDRNEIGDFYSIECWCVTSWLE